MTTLGAQFGRGRIARALRVFRVAQLLPRARARLPHRRPDLVRESSKPLARLAAEQVFSRVAGATPIEGNSLRLLRDGAENYPAWLEAIAGARHSVCFENYIFASDEVGHRFRDALAAKAREGVAVRVLYDWMGCLMKTRPGFWRPLRRAGAEVRCFNRPRLDSPFGWLSRNHRKTISVDGEIGFVAGLCVGRDWVGDRRATFRRGATRAPRSAARPSPISTPPSRRAGPMPAASRFRRCRPPRRRFRPRATSRYG